MYHAGGQTKRERLRIKSLSFAVRTRLELVTPCVTGMYSNQTELTHQCFFLCGQGQIRTAEARWQQIYSLPVLTTYLPTQSTDNVSK